MPLQPADIMKHGLHNDTRKKAKASVEEELTKVHVPPNFAM